ncbi:zinc finger CCCH domain-containing protein 30 [Ziziphus jujuba]|uniref:Zinc finger CCCH domain-containing protein 30 n=2 Tax=Ziziphus jujuba TaxID=326968 RepID=A0A6P4A7V4_ZIZJJ|nr:zinc finger CCCH domain-containing protein 30 [Ziziphus jujuba]KAH7519940.1 hypothetical protein FEM48_Zijuj08G0090700 [Ziziphus jujuba var. spinosa]
MRMNMKRSRISKRVSWAPGVNLCQVKLFSCDDCPLKVGMISKDHLEAKSSKMLHSNTMGSDGLPPGFENGFVAVSQSRTELPLIPQIQWKCPPKIVMSNNWQVASGEESEEVKHQKSRELGVLEAVFPRFSAIPPSPAVSLDVQNENYNDSCTPLVPIIPIEEEESIYTPYIPAPVNTTTSSQPLDLSGSRLRSEMLNTANCNSSAPEPLSSAQPALGKLLPGLGADAVASASAALAVVNTVGQNGSMIDTDLLIKILADPKMIQKLISEGPPAGTGSAPKSMVSPHITGTNTVTQSAPMSFPTIPDNRVQTVLNTVPFQPDTLPVSGFNRTTPSSVPAPILESHRQLMPGLPNGNLFAIPNRVRSSAKTVSVKPNTAPIATLTKDANYYKNLIRAHGGEKDKTEESIFSRKRNHHNDFQELKLDQNVRQGELKLKNAKPCIYFKTTKGCRNGINCPFQHDMPIQWRTGSLIEAHGAKRMRLGGETAGRFLL